jgi:hypothetical protein
MTIWLVNWQKMLDDKKGDDMSKDGYMGQGAVLLDPGTLRAVIDELRSKDEESAVGVVQQMYAAVVADIEKSLRYDDGPVV